MDFTAAKRLFVFHMCWVLSVITNVPKLFESIPRYNANNHLFYELQKRVVLYQALSESLEMRIMAFVEIIKTVFVCDHTGGGICL